MLRRRLRGDERNGWRQFQFRMSLGHLDNDRSGCRGRFADVLLLEKGGDCANDDLFIESGSPSVTHELCPAVKTRGPIAEVAPLELPQHLGRNMTSFADLRDCQAGRSTSPADIRDREFAPTRLGWTGRE